MEKKSPLLLFLIWAQQCKIIDGKLGESFVELLFDTPRLNTGALGLMCQGREMFVGREIMEPQFIAFNVSQLVD